MTLYEALKYGEQYLASCQIQDAQTDAWILLEYVTGIGRALFLAERMQKMDPADQKRYEHLLCRRGERIPVQHLTGVQDFMGLTFEVNEHVLIPRQDTETVVEEALARLRPGMCVLDLCTGSGCIAVSLAHYGKQLTRVDASDISAKALETAVKNAQNHQADVHFIHSSLFEEIEGTYDMIVSNPPYIRTDVIDTLEKEVRIHEPFQALDGKEDGLFFYREIIRESVHHIRENGWLIFEIGYDQGMEVCQLMKAQGYTQVLIKKDLPGLDRVVLGQWTRSREL